jgi:hypothetical protein
VPHAGENVRRSTRRAYRQAHGKTPGIEDVIGRKLWRSLIKRGKERFRKRELGHFVLYALVDSG